MNDRPGSRERGAVPSHRAAGPAPRSLLPGLIGLLAACSSAPVAGHPVGVATVAVSPLSIVLRVGQTQPLPVPLDAHGTPLAGRALAWSSGDSGVARVTSTGRVEGRVAGRTTLTATSEGRAGATAVTIAAPGAGAPDPTLLPEATPSQVPLTALYDLLHVPQLAAGQSYLDPTTGVTVYRLTSATFPTASAN